MPERSLAEQGKRPLNINHKDMRCADSIHDETRPFGGRFGQNK
jgi:hypothetical protein